MPFEVLVDRRAEREFLRLSPPLRTRVRRAFRALEDDPYRPRPGCDIRVVAGRPGLRAVRVGTWRILYVVQGSQVLVTALAHRSEAYDL